MLIKTWRTIKRKVQSDMKEKFDCPITSWCESDSGCNDCVIKEWWEAWVKQKEAKTNNKEGV